MDGTNETLSQALRYQQLGWPVFPLIPATKKPMTTHGFKDASLDPEQAKRWWARDPRPNIGIRTGTESGLVVIDVDPRKDGHETLRRLEQDHGELPGTVESITGGGGRHLFFQHPGGYVKCGNDRLGPGLDVKADGGYVVAPPSVHPKTGALYAWRPRRGFDKVPLCEIPIWVQQVIEACVTEGQSDRVNRDDGFRLSGLSVNDLVEKAIEATIPVSVSHRNDGIFDFARYLLAHPDLANADVQELRPYVKAWHKAVLPVIGTKPFDETWADFVNGRRSVRFPIGVDPAAECLQRADRAQPPAIAEEYEAAETRRLISWCWELQRVWGDKPFFLACRTVEKHLGIDHETARRRLNMLVADGVLELAKPGTSKKAARYRYLGDGQQQGEDRPRRQGES